MRYLLVAIQGDEKPEYKAVQRAMGHLGRADAQHLDDQEVDDLLESLGCGAIPADSTDHSEDTARRCAELEAKLGAFLGAVRP